MDAEDGDEDDEHLDRNLSERGQNRKECAQPFGILGRSGHQLAVVKHRKRLIRRTAELICQPFVQKVCQSERQALQQPEQQDVGHELHGDGRREVCRFGQDSGQPRADGIHDAAQMPSAQELRGGQQQGKQQNARTAENGRISVKRANKPINFHQRPLSSAYIGTTLPESEAPNPSRIAVLYHTALQKGIPSAEFPRENISPHHSNSAQL